MGARYYLSTQVARALLTIAATIAPQYSPNGQPFIEEAKEILTSQPIIRVTALALAFLVSFKTLGMYFPGVFYTVSRSGTEMIVNLLIVPFAHVIVILVCGQIVGAKKCSIAALFGGILAISRFVYVMSKS